MGIDAARLDAFAAVTIGRGLRRPGGDLFNISEAPFEMLRIALEEHDGPEAWWSPGIFQDAKRSNDRWRAQFVMVVDVDHEDAMGQHTAPEEPLDLAGAPCSYAHTTPRGARLVFLLDRPIVDKASYPRAWASIVERAERWLQQPGFVVDKQCKDLARFYWTPRATVEGFSRNAHLVQGTVPITDLADLLVTVAPVLRLFPKNDTSYITRARAWLEKADPAVSGQHGHDTAFRIIERVARGFQLDEGGAFEALRDWNARCQPPWSDAELRHKIANGLARGDTPLGQLLNAAPAPRESRVEYIQDRGQNAPIAENIARMLECDPVWRGGPKHDRYSLLTLWPNPLPEPIRPYDRRDREIVSTDYGAIQAYAIGEHQIRASREIVEQGVRMVSSRNTLDTLVDWVSALPAWDSVPRLDRWLSTYLGCDDTAYHRITGRAWLRACVARARTPGLLVDIVPILQGPQKAAKNRAINTLFEGGTKGAPWCATLGNFRPDHPDTMRLSCTRWVIHDDEYSARDTRQIDSMKSWVSRTVEQWIPKYSNDPMVMERRALLVGSVNHHQFLSDPTGARRWLVWRVGTVDFAALERDRLQLFAEAATNGNWREALETVEAEHAAIADDATAEDGLETQLQALAMEGKWVQKGLAGNVLSGLLGVAPEKQDRSWTTRLGMAVRKVGGKVDRIHIPGGSSMIRVYYPW